MNQPAPKLLVGVGNVLRHDEGVGVRVAEAISQWPLPPDVEVMDAGTAGLDAAYALEGRRLVVVVDAIDAEAEPGAVFRLAPEQLLSGIAPSYSLHDVHLLDALRAAHLLGRGPQRVTVLAVQVADISLGIGLSPPVKRALSKVVQLAAGELGLPCQTTIEPSTCASAWER